MFSSLKKIVKNENLDEEQKEVFFYSISKAYFDIGNNDLAFKYLNSANSIKLKIWLLFNKDRKEFKKIKEYFINKKILTLKSLKKTKLYQFLFLVCLDQVQV